MDIRVFLEENSQATGRDSGRKLYLNGEMTLTGFSVAGLEQYKLGQWAGMVISVPVSAIERQILWTGYAQYVTSNISGSVNGVISFAFQFRLFVRGLGIGGKVPI